VLGQAQPVVGHTPLRMVSGARAGIGEASQPDRFSNAGK
jgi:hypothetical protein